MLAYIVSVFCVIVGACVVLLLKKNQHWARKNVKGPKPQLFIGNLGPIIRKENSLTGLITNLYNEYPDEKLVGMYQGTSPTLIIRDPELIKHVLVKDFNNFFNRGFKTTDEPLSKTLFIEDGDNWRILRQRLSPIFTSGKLKLMMPLLTNCVGDFKTYTKKLANKEGPHEVRSVLARYTLKAIASCAFGLNIDPFSEERNMFREMGDKLFEPSFKTILIFLLHNMFPGIAIKLKLQIVKLDVQEFFFKLIRNIISERKGKPKVRKDFMDLIIEMKEEGVVSKTKDDGVAELEITEEIIVAQAVTFYAAGFETSSGTMAFMSYELAKYPDVQERCYQEIKEVMEKNNGSLTFENLNELQYVSLAFEETLRKYPVGGILFRQCISDSVIPGTNVKVEKGTKILIPVPGIQNDPKYFEEPEEFRPERFLPENKEKIQPCTYIPFGDGPRNCIGMRFAKVSSLLGMAHLLYNFKLELSEKTVKKVSYDPLLPTLVCKDGIWLNIKNR